MAKIIPQYTFADYGEIEILGDLERFRLALHGMDDEALMQKLEVKRYRGRNDYPIRVMWNLIIAMKVFGHRTVGSSRRELAYNSQLRKICGLDDFARRKHIVPPGRVFTGFLKLLADEQAEIDRMFEDTVLELMEKLPEFGKGAAGDRAERDAKWGVKEHHYNDKNGKAQVKKEYHFGFKTHIICDVKTELPMGYNVLTANSDEKKAMMELLGKLPCQITNRMDNIMLDRGYDSTEMIRTTKGLGIIPIVDIRNCWHDGDATKQYKETDMVYDYRGNVYMVGEKGEQRRMHYEGYDRQKNCLRYSYKGKVHRIYISYDERVFLPVARDSKKYSRLYKMRTSVERLNGRLDRDYMFEDHCIRDLKKMKLMVSLTLLTMNAMALGKIEQGTTEHLVALTRMEAAKAS